MSLIMQLCLPLIFLLGLLCSKIWPFRVGKRMETSKINLTYTMVEFHKAQCYFTSAIVIAALVLNHQAYSMLNSQRQGAESPLPPIYDIVFSFLLSMNGFVPIVFTLACLSRYHRLTWHILVLSAVPVALSTAALAATYRWCIIMSVSPKSLCLHVNAYGPGNSVVDDASALICGASPGKTGRGPSQTCLSFISVWLIYCYCILWLLGCLLRHGLETFGKVSVQQKISMVLHKLVPAAILKSLYPFSLILWAFCFGYQFYLYSVFINMDLISGDWTLGQIIAVMAWVPSVVEYFYIEHEGIEGGSRYKYPPGVQVRRDAETHSEHSDEVNLLPRPASLGTSRISRRPASEPIPGTYIKGNQLENAVTNHDTSYERFTQSLSQP